MSIPFGSLLLLFVQCACLIAEDGIIQLATPSKPHVVDAAEGLVATRWAVQPMIKNPISVSVDNRGRVFVTESLRRRGADLDIRGAGVPTEVDLSFRTVQDRAAYYRGGDYKVRYKDRNADGKVDWRDLTIESEKVHLLEDTNGDGLADRATLFAEGFNTEVTGIAAGVLAHEGDVFVTVVPDLWRLRDTNGDGRADLRDSIVTGMGVHLSYGGHDMHGLTVGPDGKLYWTIGDKGIHVVSKEGKKFAYPDTGCVMRCNPDGSEFEVFASGIRNVQEIAFDDYGNLFGADNDADHRGETERLVYLAPGGDSGWRSHYQYRKENYNPWMDEQLWHMSFEHQAAYIVPPIAYEGGGPAGFSYNPGTALNEKFRRHFFVSHAPGGSIEAYPIESAGAGFRQGPKQNITRAFISVGSNFGPDGALYVADWAGDWTLNDKGAVWKIDAPRQAGSEIRKQVQALLQNGVSAKTVPELIALLGHADQRVRLLVQFELVQRTEFAALISVAADKAALQLARIHALWGLGMLRRASDELLLAVLQDSDPEIRAGGQAGRPLNAFTQGTCGTRCTLDRRQFACAFVSRALSLAESPDAAALEPLVTMLAHNADRDPYLRHSGVLGLAGCATASQLGKLHSHDSVSVRLAAVVALRRQSAIEVALFLEGANELIVTEAARAIHDDNSIAEALPKLAALLQRPKIKQEAIIRRALSAQQRLGGAVGARNLVEYAATAGAPKNMRVMALRLLETWNAPSPLDTVAGKYVRPQGGTEADVIAALRPRIASLMQAADDSIVQYSLIVADTFNVPTGNGGLADRVVDEKLAPAARALSLQALSRSRTREKEFIALAAALLSSDQPLLRADAARLLATKRQKREEVTAYLRGALNTSTSQAEIQTGIGTLAALQLAEADKLLEDWFARLLEDRVPSQYRLDVLLAAKTRNSSAEMKKQLEHYEKQQKTVADPALRFRDILTGGDAIRGEYVFNQHEKAQCVRCHRIGEKGSDVGPPLHAAGSRLTPAHLAESIFLPQAKIAEGFGTTTLELSDGRVVVGILKSQNEESLLLAVTEAETVRVLKADVDSQTPPRSAMPDIVDVLTPHEIRDVIAYLSSLGK